MEWHGEDSLLWSPEDASQMSLFDVAAEDQLSQLESVASGGTKSNSEDVSQSDPVIFAGATSSSPRKVRKTVMQKIEGQLAGVVTAISENHLPTYIQKSSNGELEMLVRLSQEKSRRKFTVLTVIMSRAYALLKEGKTITKRDLYYENVPLFGSQKCVETAIDDLCSILTVTPSELPFVASSKGLMAAGKAVYLRFQIQGKPEEAVVVNHFATLIPPVKTTRGWGLLKSNARYVLIVEKDAVFHRLLEENIFDEFEPFILVTGKGYPDKATCAFVSKLSKDLAIPIFALVDADPYGLHIAAIYKWGSSAQKRFTKETAGLVVPSLILLGVLPSELPSLDIPAESKIPFHPMDSGRLHTLICSLKQHGNDFWINEAEQMMNLNFKVEIEAVASSGWKHLTLNYVKKKIRFHMEVYD